MEFTNDHLVEPIQQLRNDFGALMQTLINANAQIKSNADCLDFLMSGMLNLCADMFCTAAQMTDKTPAQIRTIFMQDLRQFTFETQDYH